MSLNLLVELSARSGLGLPNLLRTRGSYGGSADTYTHTEEIQCYMMVKGAIRGIVLVIRAGRGVKFKLRPNH